MHSQTTQPLRVAVVGATGYAGAELVRLLCAHPGVRLTALTSKRYAGIPFSEVFPAFAGLVEMPCEAFDLQALAARSDLVFTALPHHVSMTVVPGLLASGLRVIDLSADFRFRDPSLYARHYQPHSAPELLAQAVYGLSEVYTERIAAARLVGNPGCYPTSVLLPLIPLLQQGLVSPEGLIADAKSGVSGAGRGLSLTTHFCEVHESFKAYKVGAHRHTPEMEHYLSLAAGRDVQLTFVPHLVPMSRGMLTTIYARPTPGTTGEAVGECYARFFAGRPFVRLCGAGGRLPDTLHVRGGNCCDIGWRCESRGAGLILLSAIDNLGKGAAGQALQNMNLMLGFDETTGLLPRRLP
jgi:N-acetyl-gamma-glutamyl-phosphate reductase